MAYQPQKFKRTLLEKAIAWSPLLAFAAIVLLVLGMWAYSLFWNNRGATEARAYDGVHAFIKQNSIQSKRITCAGDSDGNGYGTCTIAATDGEVIALECPTDFIDVNVWGATSCKEVPMLRLQGLARK